MKADQLTAEERRGYETKRKLQKELDQPCDQCGRAPLLAHVAKELEIDKGALWRFVHTHALMMEPSVKKIEKWLKQRSDARQDHRSR